ncbi:MAG: transposase [Tepidiformaceae bacterium]
MSDVPFPKKHRLPLEAYAERDRVFHFTVDAAIGEQPFTNRWLSDQIWRNLDGQRKTGRVVLYAACLMPDHLHLVLSAGNESIITWLQAFKSYTTRFWWKTGRRGSLWQDSSWDRAVRTSRGDFGKVIAYVTRNPVAGGLVEEWDRWPWVAVWVGEDPEATQER